MSVPFRMIDDAATLEIDVDGYKVIVTVQPPPGTAMTTEDAEVLLASAAGLFPQRLRIPEPLIRRRSMRK